MLIGFTQSYRHVGIVEMGTRRGGLVAWNDGEGVTLLPGERRQSEELLILLDFDRNDALSKYAFEVARRKGYRKKPSERPPVGWNSGPAFFENVSWQDVMENLKAASRLKRRMPLDYFLLDDFYTTVGDWLDLRDRYLGSDAGLSDGSSREQVVSRRMQGLVQMIRQQGLTAGLWLAPLLVNSQSKLFHRLGERSEWLLHDEYGDPVNALTQWGGPNYVLDVTHPQVEAHLRRVIRTVAHVWGFKTLKLDYMFAGALHGTHRERDLTSVEAYNYFLKMMREEAMDARVILSGAPFIESAGGDYIRIGPSVADRSGPAWNPTEPDGSMPSAANSVRESLSRAFWLETLFGNVDADSLILRLGQDSRLTPPERDSIIAAVRATNSVVSLGDDLLELGDYARNLILHAFSPSCEAGRPIAFDENGRPTVMHVHVAEDQQEVTFINWKDEEDEVEFDPERFDGLGGWHFAIEDVLSGEWLGVGKGNMSFVIPPHGSKILRILKVTIPDQESGSGTLSSSDQDLV
jgi:alpha-galactosidase